MNIKRYLLSFFPENEWLKKYWWHRLVKVIAWIWFFYIMLYVVLLSNYIQAYNNLINYYDASNPSMTLWNWLKYPLFISLIIYTPIAMFAINLIYRIILFIATNNEWRNKK